MYETSFALQPGHYGSGAAIGSLVATRVDIPAIKRASQLLRVNPPRVL